VRLFLGLAAAALVQGCVFYPRTTTVHDEECRIETRRMTLQAEPFGYLASCSGKECTLMLVVIGAVTAGSAVVSGSIVVAGNVVYWMERRGKCPARHLDSKIVTASAFLFLFQNDRDVSQARCATKR
jgi:hypothetical protein